MFKASQRKNSATLHSSYLEFSQFVECICFIAFIYHSKSDYAADAMKSYLGMARTLINWIEKEIQDTKKYRNKSHLIEIALEMLKSNKK